jgi:hypothetical protein
VFLSSPVLACNEEVVTIMVLQNYLFDASIAVLGISPNAGSMLPTSEAVELKEVCVYEF